MRRNLWVCAAAIGVLVNLSSRAWAAAFIPGDLIVSRVGDGSAALTSAATAVFIDEFAKAGGAPIQSIALPTTVVNSNHRFSNSGTATSEGMLTRSVNQNVATLAGYDAAPGTASIAGTTSVNNNRVIAIVSPDGTIDTSTGLSDAFSGNNPRSVTSIDGTAFWAAGANGIRYISAPGATTSTALATLNSRVINIVSNQLYVSSSSGANVGINTTGSGMPTSGTQTNTLLPGSNFSGTSEYDYVFADANTLYVADDRLVASGGGLAKFVLEGGTWNLKYTIAAGLTNAGIRSLTGEADGLGNISLYAVTGDQDGVTAGEQNALVGISDVISNTAAPGTSFSVLAAAPANEVFRGVDFAPVASAPEPGTIALAGIAGAMMLVRRRRDR